MWIHTRAMKSAGSEDVQSLCEAGLHVGSTPAGILGLMPLHGVTLGLGGLALPHALTCHVRMCWSSSITWS